MVTMAWWEENGLDVALVGSLLLAVYFLLRYIGVLWNFNLENYLENTGMNFFCY